MEKFDKNLGLFLCYYRVTYPLISVLSHYRTNISRVNGCSLRKYREHSEKAFFSQGADRRYFLLSSNNFGWKSLFLMSNNNESVPGFPR